MLPRIIARWLTITLLGCLLASRTDAQVENGFFSLTEENDSFSNPWGEHQDRHYTQGLKFCYLDGLGPSSSVSSTLDRVLPAWGYSPDGRTFGGVFGQNIYTPQNLTYSAPIPNDRPYAGWLYLGPVYQRRGQITTDVAVMENFEVNLGIVGPWSLAEESQKTIHHWFFPDDVPAGWIHQLKTEPGLVLKYARLWRWSLGPCMDLIPHVGAEAGNVFTFGTAGIVGRTGFNLPDDFGEQIIDSPASDTGGLSRKNRYVSVYAFGGADGRAVAHDITLDGNSFRSGPSVEKKPLVGDLDFGAALRITFCKMRSPLFIEFSYTHVDRSLQFKGQNGDDVFGSLNVKCNWSW